ncbi:T-cell surface glycoprotein CD3 epsilon chain [Porphyrio hochstetteri]
MMLEWSLSLLGLLLCMAGTMAQQVFLVEISGTTVTITCPSQENTGFWELDDKSVDHKESKYVIENYKSGSTKVKCGESSSKNNELYLHAKVCENCEELDALTVTGIITADLFITLGVLILVYYFNKDRKGRGSTGAGSQPRGQKMQRPPPVPNPDYEPIRKGQREVYAGLESRGF